MIENASTGAILTRSILQSMLGNVKFFIILFGMWQKVTSQTNFIELCSGWRLDLSGNDMISNKKLLLTVHAIIALVGVVCTVYLLTDNYNTPVLSAASAGTTSFTVARMYIIWWVG